MTASTAGQEPEQHLIHVEDVEVEIEHHPEDWLAFALFWALAFIVFLQFFTRYVLNDSYAWTEEIATYCLIGVVFIGSAMCVRLSRHIQVDLVFRYLPHLPARAIDGHRPDPDRVLRLCDQAGLAVHPDHRR
jgi:hypothetical protein